LSRNRYNILIKDFGGNIDGLRIAVKCNLICWDRSTANHCEERRKPQNQDGFVACCVLHKTYPPFVTMGQEVKKTPNGAFPQNKIVA
jgi:hypothetical protein